VDFSSKFLCISSWTTFCSRGCCQIPRSGIPFPVTNKLVITDDYVVYFKVFDFICSKLNLSHEF
jgi:hypothetical protein